MDWLETRVPPPVVALLVGAAVWWLAPLGPAMAGADALRPWLALGLVGVGAGFDMTGLIAFLRRHTTINPLRPANARVLVTGGIYRITRNPMYVGLVCFLTAWAVWLGAWLALAGPVVFVLYITRFQIRPEERALTALFGQPYTDYTQRVRRWL
jgi:protein-S-isoprenylcysteine O-methyltransferase Ste14